MNRYELRDELENDLKGDCVCDYITKSELCEILDDFDSWLETAKSGDVYYYGGNSYELTIEYEIVVWKNSKAIEEDEPLCVEPTSSRTELEVVKKEAEKYNIESTGYIEIFEKDEDDAILRFESGRWNEVCSS